MTKGKLSISSNPSKATISSTNHFSEWRQRWPEAIPTEAPLEGGETAATQAHSSSRNSLLSFLQFEIQEKNGGDYLPASGISPMVASDSAGFGPDFDPIPWPSYPGYGSSLQKDGCCSEFLHESSENSDSDDFAAKADSNPGHDLCHDETTVDTDGRSRLSADSNIAKDLVSVAASSVCSVNGEKAEHWMKRKRFDSEESEIQSDDLEDEFFDAKKKSIKASRRNRVAEVHNLSEKRRRDKINEKMRALRELIPNCNKVDKVSMLDDAIEYLKALQFQLQMMSLGRGMLMASMFPAAALPHQYMAAAMAGAGMGFGMGCGGMGMHDMAAASSAYPLWNFAPPAAAADHGMHQMLGAAGRGGFPFPPPSPYTSNFPNFPTVGFFNAMDPSFKK